MTWHELLSDIAIIPAWECFLFGVLIGMVITLLVIIAGGE